MVAGDDGAEAGVGGDDAPPAAGLGVVPDGGTEAVAGGSARGLKSPVAGGLGVVAGGGAVEADGLACPIEESVVESLGVAAGDDPAGGGAEAIAGGEVSGVEADETGFSGGTEGSELVSGGGDGGTFEISDDFEDSGNGEA